MLIRSQNKDTLINLDNVTQIYINNDNSITVDFNKSIDEEYGGCEDIGTYSTNEKSLEVLDKIQHLYDDNTRPVEWHNAHKVFQMPQDEEVIES